MARVVLSRLFQSIPTLILVSIIVFSLLELSPGDPAEKSFQAAGLENVSPEDVAARREELGLNRPIVERYVDWVWDVVNLEMGNSYVNRKPVSELLSDRIPASLTLAAVAMVLSMVVALPLGVISAVRANSWVDSTIRVLTLVGSSLPGFWVALVLMWLFAVKLAWLPALGSFSPLGIILPATVLTIRTVGLLARVTRTAVLDTLRSEYITVALSKGLHPRRVLIRHVVPNASIPILTVLGLDLAGLVAHAAIVEWVFAWPGIGRMGVDAALAQDAPVVLGFVIVSALVVLTTNLIVDIAYGYADPRVRRAGTP